MYAQRSDQRFFLPVFAVAAQVGDQGGRRVPARPRWISIRGYQDVHEFILMLATKAQTKHKVGSHTLNAGVLFHTFLLLQ
jgi:hypothetical protein